MRHLTIVIFVVLLASGCSFRQVILDYADWMMIRRLDDMFDLEDPLYSETKARVSRIVAAMKANDLPHVAELLKQAKQLVESKDIPTDLGVLESNVWKLRAQLGKHLAPDIQWLFSKLNVSNWKALAESFKERNETLVELSQAAPKDFFSLVQERQEAFSETLEDLFGNLSKKQLAMVRLAITDDQSFYRQQLHERKLIQASYTGEMTSDEKSRILIDWISSPREGASKAYLAILDRRREARENFLKAFIPSLSGEQVAHFHTELDGWIKVLTSPG